MAKSAAALLRCFKMSPEQIILVGQANIVDREERKIASKIMLKQCKAELKELFESAQPTPPWRHKPTTSYGEEEKRLLWLHSEAGKAEIHSIFEKEKLQYEVRSDNNIIDSLQVALRQAVFRAQALLEFVCEFLSRQERGFNSDSYRDYIRPAMDFLDKLARTQDVSRQYSQDDERLLDKFISSVKANDFKPRGDDYSISEQGIEFKELDDYPFDQVRGCFVREILFDLNLCLKPDSQVETVNMVKAFYWFIARKVEDALFKGKEA